MNMFLKRGFHSKCLTVFGLALLVVYLGACHPVVRDNQTGERYYIFQLEDRTYHLPYGYVWAYDSVSDGKIKRPNLHALYPG